ncbi:gamma-glutamyltranspeptidase/glutathione hydrolase [Brevundimonas vesicularis]|uniref:gamma-glutamyltransferase family protein n=1 Tax=Brevundimonas TaxID=41275 RepID=UPI00087E8987|nr:MULTISPECIES: gamma-glutamyltransferase family protein [Brevundimonas]MDQ1191302.1 gamma-glutamyltranspeptidase/glutathione hydrolase [Brevundimonas vesicularis]SDR17421.1 gamma-glutamyltranspeptidase / glutathione hydrolase [Brevundimonas sp. 374]
MRSFRRQIAAVLVPVLLAGCQTATASQGAPALATASPQAVSAPSSAASHARGPFVAAANPLAVEAGMTVLRRGGSAVDAAVAIQAVLGLVEPQSSGLGGGAFLMSYDAETGTVTAYDGRETAPASATPELFYEDGKPLGFMDAVLSGRSTGAPGAVAMLAMAQKDHGKLAWRDLFGDAERLARDGFTVSPRLAGMINGRYPQARTRWASAYFTKPDGTRYQAGDTLKNPAYADTVARLAQQGPGVVYGGPIGRDIAAAVREGPRPGGLTEADIAGYRPLRRDALCRPYQAYVVCVPPPPSSGVALLQFLAMADATPDLDKGAKSPEAWVAFGRLQRLMYADRDRYIGDNDFVGVPIAGLLDSDYVASRAALAPQVNGPVEAGAPTGSPPRGVDQTAEPGGTSHMVVVDAWGNAVSMTTTVESIFGNGRMVDGFFLNNQLTDFSFTPHEDGHPAANAVAAGKRPRSSMTPVLILDRQGRLVGAIGSPGGSSILAYVAKALVGTMDWGLSMQEAIALPNLVVRGEMVGADTDLIAPHIRDALAAAGMALRPNATETSGLHGAIWRDGRWDGGADPRREGVALSEIR